MPRRLVLAVIVTLTLLRPDNADAQYCPEKIAAIDGDMSRKAAGILATLYKKLGCPVKVMFLPGRRGLMQFNNAKVDGELNRHAIIESKYKRPFVRSAVPMLHMVNGLWSRPAPLGKRTKPIGYALGIAWQDEYAADRPNQKFIAYRRAVQVIEAYNRGEIDKFVSIKQVIAINRARGTISPVPVLEKRISRLPLHHYLDKKYAAFMADFSEALRRDNPFRVLE